MTEPYQPSEGLLRQEGSLGEIGDGAAPDGRPYLASRHSRRAVHSSDHSEFRSWLITFAVLWFGVAAWSFASPLGSGPDEPAHLIRAASLVRGELVGKPVPHARATLKSTVTVEAPQVFSRLANDVGCFQFKNAVPASCQGPLGGSRKDVPVYTYVGRYPPLYYALVGLPTLAFVSPTGMYLARLVSGALSAALLALAVTSLRRCRGAPLLGAGLAVAITPMVLYLAAVVNPSGLEIASAISAWAAAMAIASQPPGAVSASAIGALGISAVALILTRPLSPLWALFIAGALVGLCSSWRSLLRRLIVQGWLAGCMAAGVAALVWDLVADPFLTEPGAPLPPGTTGPHVVVLAAERLDLLVTSSIGLFGWLDTPSPFAVTVTWLAALGAVVLVGVSLAHRRGAALVAGNVIALVAVPLVLIVAEARHNGILGQGRDFMPLGVGIPVLAGAVAGERFADRRTTLRFATLIITALAVCQAVDFYGALHRYTVGVNGPLNVFAAQPGAWHPPLPPLVLVTVFTVAMAAFAVLVRQAARVQPPALVAGGVRVTGQPRANGRA